MAEEITRFVISHTNELCANVIPSMENSLLKDVTSTIEIADYTVTISISKKQGVLGKRRYESQAQVAQVAQAQVAQNTNNRNTKYKQDASSDKLLYNSFGHNFLDMYS
jgi:hypothetical protein